MRYEPALDGLRAVAILAVIAFHTAGMRGGWAGVDIFFVLSGFLITTIVEARLAGGRFRLGAFYLRRTMRLYPALLLMSAVIVIATFTRNDGAHLRELALVALTYTMNWRRTWDTGSLVPFDHTWSLAIEAQFYLVWPLFLTLVPQRRKLPAASALLALAMARRWWLVAAGAPSERIYNGLDTHADALLAGCVIALAIARDQPIFAEWRGGTALLALLAFFAFAGGPAPLIDWWGLSLATVIASVALLGARSGGLSTRLLSAKPLVYVGRISYGVYLWQGAVLFWFHLVPPYGMIDAAAFAVATAAASIALASLSFHLVERPLLRWHDRASDHHPRNAACAAASRAIGTRYGDALT